MIVVQRQSSVGCLRHRRYAASICIVCLTCLASLVLAQNRSIRRSKHDLTVTGPGPTKATRERDICIFCHTPHRASSRAPLWNRQSSGATYVPYDSTTIEAAVGQPTGASKLCLSCHDGTVALGAVRSRPTPIPFAGGIVAMPPGRPATLHTDLSDDHPISFVYDQDLYKASGGRLRDPEKLEKTVPLDRAAQVQCTSCHDAHSDKFGKFLVMDNSKSALCMACHDVTYWPESVHRTSAAKWNGRSANPWPRSKHTTVANNGCGNCHRPHAAASAQRLLKFAEEEKVCLACHNGNVAGRNIRKEFRKLSVHGVEDTTEVHDPTEDPINPTRHVECQDCHNPHAVNDTAAKAPNASGSLRGVKGVDSSGSVVKAARFEYQVCYRCHADSKDRGPARVERVSPETNVRLEFDAANASYHPVEARGKNPDVPSLIQPLDEASMIYCSGCHSGDDGIKGPHGSKWVPILSDRLVLTDFANESASMYALCYKCHSRNSILSDASFPFHNKHVKDETTACTTCHDPHGAKDNGHLINFNRDYVSPNNGIIEFIDDGDFSGSCTLTCHGSAHDNRDY